MIAYGNHANHNIVKPIVCGVNWDSGTSGEAICQPLLLIVYHRGQKRVFGHFHQGGLVFTKGVWIDDASDLAQAV